MTFAKLWHKGANAFFEVLRFLNLLEPRKRVLSISKTFMWVMVFAVVYVLFFHPANIVAVIAAAGGQLVATANYAFRRHTQFKIGDLDAFGINPDKQTDTGSSGPGGSTGDVDNNSITEG